MDDQSAFERDIERAWDLLDDDDLEGAASALDSARALEPEDPAVLELDAELARAHEDPAAALTAYERWAQLWPDDPEAHLGAAEIYLHSFNDPGAAIKIINDLIGSVPLHADEEADARHLLAAAHERRHDHKNMVREWLAVLRLDAASAEPEPVLEPDQFNAIAERALAELPDELLERLGNVPILVDDRPTEGMVLQGIDPRTLGLFSGFSLPDQSVMGGAPQTGLIHLFQRNLEAESEDEDELEEQIRITILHETAHYFGWDDDDMERLGLD
ncbi:MAG: metallopeptidase family protein [Thermoleophilia bacterium]